MFAVAPGEASGKLVGDLAEGLGKPSDGGKTWTYKLREGLKFEDGTAITSKDVKYGVERSTDKAVFPDGPAYFDSMLDWPAGYKGPYKSKGVNTDSAISTPDDTTIVFHLKAAFAGFDYLAMTPQSAPVPAAKDQGAKQKQHVISSGPYMFADLRRRQELHAQAQPELGPGHRPEPQGAAGRLRASLNVDAEDIDNRLISGDVDIAIAGTGVTAASQSRVLGDPTLKARADNPTLGRLWYTSINPTVKPFDNIECRKADRVRDGQDVLPDCLRRRVRRWLAGDDPAAAGHPGLQAVRPVPDTGR